MSSEYTFYRAHGLKTRFLSKEDFGKLEKTKSLGEVINILRSKGYGREIDEFLKGEKDIYALEVALTRNWLDSLYILFSTAEPGIRDFIRNFSRKIEVLNLKRILWWKSEGKKIEDEHRRLIVKIPPRLSSINFNALLKAKDLDEAVDLLRFTPYYEFLMQGLMMFKEKGKAVFMEKALEKAYKRLLLKSLQELKVKGVKEAAESLGYIFSLEDIFTVIQLKGENVPPEEIEKYIVKAKKTELIDSMTRARNLKGAIDALRNFPLGFMLSEAIDKLERTGAIVFFEEAVKQQIMKEAAKTMRKTPYGVGYILGYLFLKEAEIRNLVAIANSKVFEVRRKTLYH